jgi:hypothetical protein
MLNGLCGDQAGAPPQTETPVLRRIGLCQTSDANQARCPFWVQSGLRGNVRFWRKAAARGHVCCWVKNGHATPLGRGRLLTQCMVRPCVARRFRRAGGKRSCINVSGLWLEAVLRAIMDISAPATSLADRPRLDHLGHQFLQAPGRPNLHLFSSSRRPRQVSNSGTCDHAV